MDMTDMTKIYLSSACGGRGSSEKEYSFSEDKKKSRVNPCVRLPLTRA
jgi:hypothetical protein